MNKLSKILFSLICLISLIFISSCNKVVDFTITFDSQGGSEVSNVIVEQGKTFVAPSDPIHNVNTFKGWFTDKECKNAYDFNEAVNSNLTLYAKWTRVLTIYTINDFHGAIEDKAAKVGEFIMSRVNKNAENSVVLSAGDMFQGSGLSNYNRGLDMVNIMNIINFDAMSVGNHEFDWELGTVLDYFDNNKDNGEANFPLLGCNVVDKSTGMMPENMEEFVVVERTGLKIGVIGYIGSDLESSIATNMVSNYEFIDPVSIIANLSKKLRTEQNVDVVIALGHDGSSTTNYAIANLSGDSRVDAIVNGHEHTKTSGKIRRSSDNVNVPYVQAGSSGEAIGIITLELEPSDNSILSVNAIAQTLSPAAKENQEIKSYVNKIVADTSDYFDRVIGISGKSMNVYDGLEWVANSIYEYSLDSFGLCDVAFVNLGGVRDAAFPIKLDEEITVKRIYSLMPFDNTINLSTIKGSILRNLINAGELEYSSLSVTKEGTNVYIKGVLLNDNQEYRVAVVDYIFDKDTYPFNKGHDIYLSGILLRDILIKNIEEATLSGNKCFIGKE